MDALSILIAAGIGVLFALAAYMAYKRKIANKLKEDVYDKIKDNLSDK
jgi:hypothetical protein